MSKASLCFVIPAILVILSGCSSSKSSMPPVEPTAAAPTFSPAAGSYNSSQSVTIADATPGTKIYYTTDGSAPTTASTQYTAVVSVSSSETLKAIAVSSGFSQSQEADAAYTISHPVMYTIAGTGNSIDCGLPYGGSMVATESELSVPGGVAVDAAGNVYIADFGDNCIREISQSTGILTAVVNNPGGSFFPQGISLDSAGNLYIADIFNNSIREFSPSSGNLTVVAGGGNGGDGGPATSAQLSSPEDVAVDSAGNLYIADSGHNTVRKVTAGTGIISTVAGSGTSGYSGDGGAATSAELYSPAGVALDSAGDLFIADTGNNVVREVSAKTGAISTAAGNGYGAGSGKTGTGIGGYKGDGGPAASAELFNPEGVAFDSAGNLYIADNGNAAIREVSMTGIITTVAGNGTSGYNGSGEAAGSSELASPEKVAVGKTGNLYIADTSNNLVREVVFYPSLPTTAAPTPAISPAAGTIQSETSVIITDSNPDAQIYYTTDGSTPTTASAIFSFGILVESTETVQAIALAPGSVPSAVASAAYTYKEPVNVTPTFSPPGGKYASTQTVSICCADDRFTVIFYWIDGPNSSSSTTSARYDDAIIVNANETLNAVVGSANAATSAVGSASYTITSPANQLIYSVAGDRVAGYSGDGGIPTVANLRVPQAVAVDTAGNLYIADTVNNAIREVSATTGLITTIAGGIHEGYSGDGGPAIDAKLSSPTDLAIDKAGDIYIADSGNNVIRRISASTSQISTVAGTGQAGFAGDGAAATESELSSPSGIALDQANDLYVADGANLRVRKVAAATGIISTVAGGGQNGDGGLATTAALTAAHRVALDKAGNLYISCANTIEMVSAKTGIINAVAGFNPPTVEMYFVPFLGDGGPALSGFLTSPQGIEFDSAGNLYIADAGDNRIREVFASTGIITTIAGSDLVGPSGDGGPGTNAALSSPADIAMDGKGGLYIADSQNMLIRKLVTYNIPPTSAADTPAISPAGGSFASPPTVNFSDSTPGSALYYTFDGTTPTTASPMYSGPMVVPLTETLRTIALAPNYVVSDVDSAAFTVTAPSAIISTVAGLGPGDEYHGGNPIYAVNYQLTRPISVVTDGTGNFYIADQATYTDLEVTTSTGMIARVAGDFQQGSTGNGGPATSALLGAATYLGLDTAGNLYIADDSNNVIREVVAKTGIINSVVGNGQAGYSGDGGNALSAELNGPSAVAFDLAGNLYIADLGNNVVREVSAKTGIISTIAGNGSPGYSGDGGIATSAALNQPAGIAVDNAGDIYIADLTNCAIREVSAKTGIISTIAGNGICGYGGDGGPAASAELNGPSGIALDLAGDLFIADTYNQGIRKVFTNSGIIETIAGNGEAGYTGDGGPAIRAELNYPQSVAIDPMGNLYIADSYNAAIRKVTFSKGSAGAVKRSR
jgi:sugar lactone lactonase YvrE